MVKNSYYYVIALSCVLCLQVMARDLTLVSFRAPESYIKTVCGEKHKFSETRVFAELLVDGEIVWRSSKALPFVGNRDAYYFNEELTMKDNWKNSHLVVRVLIGEDKDLEHIYNIGAGVAGGAVGGAGVGAMIGAFAAGVVTGGLGAPAGAAIGAAIGGGGGAVAGGVVAGVFIPVEGARELSSFEFLAVDDMPGTHARKINIGDILSDGKVIELEIK